MELKVPYNGFPGNLPFSQWPETDLLSFNCFQTIITAGPTSKLKLTLKTHIWKQEALKMIFLNEKGCWAHMGGGLDFPQATFGCFRHPPWLLWGTEPYSARGQCCRVQRCPKRRVEDIPVTQFDPLPGPAQGTLQKPAKHAREKCNMFQSPLLGVEESGALPISHIQVYHFREEDSCY